MFLNSLIAQCLSMTFITWSSGKSDVASVTINKKNVEKKVKNDETLFSIVCRVFSEIQIGPLT